MARKKKGPTAAGSGWLQTYSDCVTLCLCFFVMLYNPSEVDVAELANLTSSIAGDPLHEGANVTLGRLSDLGNNVNALPSVQRGRSLGPGARTAISLFAPEIKSSRITVTSDERGLVITLAADSFFRTGSAEVNIEETRETLLKLAGFLSDEELSAYRFRIEGHTDTGDTDPEVWPSNWELSSARAINVLHYLTDFGADESRFSVAGYADTRPFYSNETAEGRAYNRRVDVIVLNEGHF